MNEIDQLRNKTLQEINAWCYKRASHLSITGHDKAAQALTEEHMELLQNVNPENLLWVGNWLKQHFYRADELCRTWAQEKQISQEETKPRNHIVL